MFPFWLLTGWRWPEVAACGCAALYGAPGFALALSGSPWAGLLAVIFALYLRRWVLAQGEE